MGLISRVSSRTYRLENFGKFPKKIATSKMIGRTLARHAKFVHRPIKSRFHKAPSENLYVRGEGAKPVSGIDLFSWWSTQQSTNIMTVVAYVTLGSFVVMAATGSEP